MRSTILCGAVGLTVLFAGLARTQDKAPKPPPRPASHRSHKSYPSHRTDGTDRIYGTDGTPDGAAVLGLYLACERGQRTAPSGRRRRRESWSASEPQRAESAKRRRSQIMVGTGRVQ